MSAGICLMKETADKFLEAVKDGRIDPGKLAAMSSAERNEYFGQIVGKNHATAVNSLFESKLLLKNQKQGMVTWAKQVSGIKPAARRDLIKKIENLQNVLDPGEQKQFLRDLTATRLGIGVTEDEAKSIADLSKRVTELESLRRPDKTFPTNEDRMNYGRAVEDLTDYVGGLKQEAGKIRPTELARNPGLLGKFTSRTAGNLKSLQASLDNSAIFRQGWKVLFTDPNIWRKNAAETFSTIAKTIGGKNVLREVNADIISRPNYDKYIRAGLAIKNPEEAFPESLAEKVPALGRLYKASEAAFTGFQYKNRADIFDKYLEIAKKSGVDIEDADQLKAIGKLVNSLTGRGNLGRAEPVATAFNNFFFSPRFVKANIDTLTLHALDKGITSFARKKAATNLLKIIGGTAAVLAIADAVLPGSVELDPRSSNFGKIKVGDTTFDVTGGMGSIATLAARQISGKTKSATSGKITDLTSGGFGSQTRWDVATDFLAGKLSPSAGIFRDWAKGQDYNGNKPTAKNEGINAISPIGVQTLRSSLSDPNSANTLLTMIADGLGVGANVNAPKGSAEGTSWSQSNAKDLSQFKDSVGNQKFNEAAHQFDNEYNAWLNAVTKNPRYQDLSTDDKASLLTKKQDQLKTQIFKTNGFKYKRTPAKKTDKSLL